MPRLTFAQFEPLVREHHAAVYRAALRVHGEPADAADTAQEVFVRVLAGKVALARADDVRAMLCWLAAKLASNAVRARRVRDHHEENAMTMRTTPAEDPAQVCEDRDLHRSVQQCVHELPGDLRVPLQLRCADGLSFAAIGTALSIPESTVHERVQRALHRVRQALTGRGLALAAAGVPELLAAVPQPPAPGGLQSRLLALGESGALVTVGVVRRMVTAVLGIGAAVVIVVAAQTRGETATAGPGAAASAALAATAPVDAQEPTPVLRVAAPPVTSDAQEPAPKPAAKVVAASVFTGTVLDSGAWPVAGASIVAVAGGGLKPFALASTTTDAHGAFRLELGSGGKHAMARVTRLQVIEDGRRLLETPDLALPRDATAAPLQLTLPAAVGTAMSRYQLVVTVRGADGAPLAGVPVSLLAAGEQRPVPGHSQAEAEVVTGDDGLARIGGRTLGSKWLFVDGRGVARCTSFTPLLLERAGEHQTSIDLLPGGSLAGRFTTVDGALIEWANVWLEDETSGLRHTAELAADGSIAFAGLGTGPYTLRTYLQQWSAVEKRSLRAGGPPFAVQLKRSFDPRDIGDHMAELHGALVDAATGAKIDFGSGQVGVFPAREGESTLLLDRVEPPRPVQTLGDDTRYEQFHLVGLIAGRWIVVASVAGYSKGVAEFTLGDGELRADVSIPLERPAHVRGICVDAAGQPVPRANVFVVGVGELPDRALDGWRAWGRADQDVAAPLPSMLACSAVTAADGSFVLDRVPPGVAVRVVARQKGRDLVVEGGRVFRSGEQVDGLRLQFTAR